MAVVPGWRAGGPQVRGVSRGGDRRVPGPGRPRAAVATAAFPAVANGYDSGGYANGYNSGGYRTGGYPGGNGYTGTVDGYAGAADDFDGAQDGYGRTGNGYARGGIGYAGTGEGYAETHDGYAGAGDVHAGADDGYEWADSTYADEAGGYDWSRNGYGGTADGFESNGYGGAAEDFAGGTFLGPGSYTEYADPVLSVDPVLTAPDTGVHPDRWRADQERRREASQRGPMVGALMELLATGVVIGVSTLAAALLKAQTSPVSAMGAVFIDRTPAALRNVAVQHFGAHGRTVLLLGMYAAFAVVAIVIGVLARRAAALGVAGIAAFTLFAAFAVITRPASHMADVTPAVVGGIAGVAALLWLFRASAPVAPLRHARGGNRRRAR